MNLNNKENRVYGLDVFRAVAILIVLFAHGKLLSGNAFSFIPDFPLIDGVELFFVLSGFLIGGILISTIAYGNEKTNFSFGYGFTGNSSAWSAGGKIDGYGGSYYKTTYGSKVGYDGNPNKQVVGGVGLNFGIVTIREENDFFGDRHDRWRSQALEIGIGSLVLGTNLYNNDPEGEHQGINPNGTDRRGNLNNKPRGAWDSGKTYYSPWYVGYKSGNNITKVGYSHPSAQDLLQNNVHRLFPPGYQNFYNDYSQFKQGSTLFNGSYNPFSLW